MGVQQLAVVPISCDAGGPGCHAQFCVARGYHDVPIDRVLRIAIDGAERAGWKITRQAGKFTRAICPECGARPISRATFRREVGSDL